MDDKTHMVKTHSIFPKYLTMNKNLCFKEEISYLTQVKDWHECIATLKLQLITQKITEARHWNNMGEWVKLGVLGKIWVVRGMN